MPSPFTNFPIPTVTLSQVATNWTNVKAFGAMGNGVTDDTAAINTAIASIPSTGGVLYFPAGNYVTSGGFVIANETTILGDGMGDINETSAVSQITCTVGNVALFTVTAAQAARFIGLSLICTAGTFSSPGCAILVNGSNQFQKVDYRDITVFGFYNGIDIEVSFAWAMNNCFIGYQSNYGLIVRNVLNPDNGDWHISDTVFNPGANSQAGIRYESSGGGSLVNVKINPGSGPPQVLRGLDVSANGTTSQILVTNCSFEGTIDEPIRVVGNGVWRGLNISNCYLRPASANIAAISVTNFLDVNIGSNVLRNDAGGTNAISITNCTNVIVNPQTTDGFTNTVTQSGNTNILIETLDGGNASVSFGTVGPAARSYQFNVFPANGSNPTVQIDNQFGVVLGGFAAVLAFAASTASTGTVDLQVGRWAAGILAIGNGSNNAGVIYPRPTTFAGLPATPAQGMMATITDGLATNCGDGSCTTFGTTVTGGTGALHLNLWYNGSNWTLIGK